ncbi:MAG TPA: hypothetical protein ENN80_10190, partial [Candidatus Hydrogenedentes bacterium]|nr:hypothetical protein [Candidatus Hydrogenedentota bacterium]
MKRLLPSLLAAIAFLVPTLAAAQMTDAEIEALREQGEKEGWTFSVGRTPATERPPEQLAGFVVPDDPTWIGEAPKTRLSVPAKDTLPSSFDWRTEVAGGLPPVRNQGACGSCWAFATVGTLECAIKLKDGINVDLSEQWLLG